jgi:hypothetical protein
MSMTNLSQKVSSSVVLVAYSKNFSNGGLLKQKIEKLTERLQDFSVVAFNDDRKFVRTYFGKNLLDSYKIDELRSTELRKLVNAATHIIVFWDGSDLSSLIYQALLSSKPVKIIPVETTKVVNKDRGEKFDVYIGRGTPWGNPFAIGVDKLTRDDVIEKYKAYFVSEILGNETKRKDLLALKGKVLGCHCKPLPCHGDTIAEYLNSLDEEPPF